MLTISNNPTRKGLSVFRPNVIYSTASGVELLYLFREVHGIFLILPTKFLN